MSRFWISWQERDYESFEYHGPWWVSGEAGDGSFLNICAAVVADTEEDAKRIIREAHDVVPDELEWRFCTEKPCDWEPAGGRFEMSNWMKWPVDGDELDKLRSKR